MQHSTSLKMGETATLDTIQRIGETQVLMLTRQGIPPLGFAAPLNS